MSDRLPPLLLASLSAWVTEHLGLDFPPERWPELERGIRAAAPELGFDDVEACARQLVTAPVSRKSVEILASHLTIGETYFFREKKTLTIFTEQILPALIQARRGQEQRLRLWSAGCCTGEEPYSLAILLCQALPDVQDWNITILGTDVNPRFLQKAAAGVFSEWSFRATSAPLKERYFQKANEGRFEVVPRIKKMVKFSSLNLAEDGYPSLRSGTNAMDVIFCRNVLIYFAPLPAQKIVGNFHRSLAEGGWLIVSPAETSAPLFTEFTTVNFSDATLYRKESEAPNPPAPFPVRELGAVAPGAPLALRVASAAAGLGASGAGGVSSETASPLLLARACANQGNLTEAREWCEKAIALDKLSPLPYYLRATIQQEEGAVEEAVKSLKRSLYLDHDFVLAHFALGNLTRQQGKAKEFDRHLANALQLLQNYGEEDLLPESEGMTAGRLRDIIASLQQARTPS